MALSVYAELWNEVLLHCPLAGPDLARRWVKNAFRQLAERRRWSWLMREGQFLFPAAYKTGTVAVTFNNATVTGTSTVWDSSMVGQEFRVSSQTPIYTISTVDSATSLTLDRVWGGDTATGKNYEIYKAYQTVPVDFRSFIVLIDPKRNWKLRLNVTQLELNGIDPQRAASGPSYVVASYTYDLTSTPPLARYEFWPHSKSQYVYPYLYEARPTDLEDSGATLPRMVRGEVVVEYALYRAASWPGPSRDKPNPYFNLALARFHQQEAERMTMELERQDDEIYEQDVTYTTWQSMPFAIVPMLDSGWLQSHAI